MAAGSWLALALALVACSSASPPAAAPAGHVVVVLTIDWEGAELATDGFEALDELRATLGPVPITHFVSAAYATKDKVAAATVAAAIRKAVRPGDELAVHLHGWVSLARASGIEPRAAPSFLTGTDTLLDVGDGDTGFDTDLDTYDVPALRALLGTSRRLLEATGLRVSRSFRAGGYLGTPKMLRALVDEGFAADSSAIDARQLHELDDGVLPQRLRQVWPKVDPTAQPFVIRPGTPPLVEVPIAAVVDYVTTAELVARFESAHDRLQRDPARDVFVVVAFHLETAAEFSGRLGDALATVRAKPQLATELVYATVEQAAELARFEVAPASPAVH